MRTTKIKYYLGNSVNTLMNVAREIMRNDTSISIDEYIKALEEIQKAIGKQLIELRTIKTVKEFKKIVKGFKNDIYRKTE